MKQDSRSFILLVKTGAVAVAAAAAVDAAAPPCCVAPLSPIVLCSFLEGRTLSTAGQVQSACYAQETEGGAAFATADRGGGRVRQRQDREGRPPAFLTSSLSPLLCSALCVYWKDCETVCVVCNARKEVQTSGGVGLLHKM